MPFSEKITKKALFNCASIRKRKEGIDNYTKSCYNVYTTNKGEIKMNEIKIIKDIMESSTPKVTQDVLRERLGYSAVSGVSERLRGKSIKVDTYVKFLDALGYELIVQPKTARDAREGCYKVGGDE
jgi:hypothetical protein